MSYNSKYKGAEVESLLDKVNDMGEIPTKVSQLENDVPYVTEDAVPNGVYAVDANGKLIDYNLADTTATGVALVAGEHKFMIAKSDATDGTNKTLYWTKSESDLSLTNYSNADGTYFSGYLPRPSGTFYDTPHLSSDYTTWTSGALSDFNGKTNTAVIAAASSDARDMCTVLNTFNDSDIHNDWYVPACGQLALMYLNMTEINAALAKIGGNVLADGTVGYYWSSSEVSSGDGWYVGFHDALVNNRYKSYYYRVRFIRDITPTKPLKERVSELETTKQDMIEDLDDIRDGASKGATALQEEQYKGTVTSVTAGEGLAGGIITGSGIISLEEKAQNGKFIDLMSNVDILKIGNTSSDTNITINNTSSVWMDKMLNFDKFGRLNGIDGYYYYPTKVTFGEATTSLKGLMSASDKAKLDGIDLTGKQDKLVSGTNIKTINGESILGSGNIVISGGGSSSGGGGGAYAEVSHGTGDTTFALTPNTFHVWDEVASLDLSFAEETAGVANEYLFQFTSGATATTLTLPDGLKWANDSAPTIAENMIYQVSVLKGLASVLEFNNAADLIENKATLIDDTTGEVRFDYPVASNLKVVLRGEMSDVIQFSIGQQTGKASVDTLLEPYVIYDINLKSDSKYIYTF